MSKSLIVALLIANLRDVDALAIFFKLSKHVIQVLQLLLVVLLLDQLNFQIFLVFLELLLDYASISNQTAAGHVVLVLQAEDFLLELVDGVLDLAFLLDDLVQLATFFQTLQLLQFLLIVLYDLFVVDGLCIEDILTRGLRRLAPLLSLLLLLLQIYVDDLLELLQHAQQLLVLT